MKFKGIKINSSTYTEDKLKEYYNVDECAVLQDLGIVSKENGSWCVADLSHDWAKDKDLQWIIYDNETLKTMDTQIIPAYLKSDKLDKVLIDELIRMKGTQNAN